MQKLYHNPQYIDKGETETLYNGPLKTIATRDGVSTEVTLADQMAAMEISGALEFWDDPAEDIYGEDDGK